MSHLSKCVSFNFSLLLVVQNSKNDLLPAVSAQKTDTQPRTAIESHETANKLAFKLPLKSEFRVSFNWSLRPLVQFKTATSKASSVLLELLYRVYGEGKSRVKCDGIKKAYRQSKHAIEI